MAIPNAQLESWSHQGAMTTSRDTYAIVKRALESANTRYANRKIEVFLQGSYGNDTNVYSESDVDIVICCTDAFYHDLEALSPDQKSAFQSYFINATYDYNTFKADVQAALVAAFGISVQPPNKAFKIAANGARRNADVVAAFQHRRYWDFKGGGNGQFFEGISFFTPDNKRIDNFPAYHSKNLTTKHQATGNRFKPAIRIFKNMRSKLIAQGLIDKGEAQSYFIEGLLYNVPNDVFVDNLSEMVFGILVWLHKTTDRTKFLCTNELYYLFRNNSAVCWPETNGEKFINAAIGLWNKGSE